MYATWLLMMAIMAACIIEHIDLAGPRREVGEIDRKVLPARLVAACHARGLSDG
jgi:hypothetical protein